MERSNYWRLAERQWTRRRLLKSAALGGAGLGAAALIGCGGNDSSKPAAPATQAAGAAATQAAAATPKRGGIWRNSTIGDPPGLDPYTSSASISRTFASHMYSRLYKIPAEPG